jgi:hypothetical protein
MGQSSSRRRAAAAAPPAGGAPAPGGAAAGGYPGAAAPQPGAPHYVHPNMYGGQRAMPQAAGGMFPFMDGSRPPELRGDNLYPWRPMPRQMMPQMQKTYTIKNDVNLKKTTLKIVRDEANPSRYALEFDFDTSTHCRLTVFLVATEVEGQHAQCAHARDGAERRGGARGGGLVAGLRQTRARPDAMLTPLPIAGTRCARATPSPRPWPSGRASVSSSAAA